jgi:hypothetical protein
MQQYNTAALPRVAVERLLSTAEARVTPSLIVTVPFNCYVLTLITQHTNNRRTAFAFLMSSGGSLKLYTYCIQLTNFRHTNRDVK